MFNLIVAALVGLMNIFLLINDVKINENAQQILRFHEQFAYKANCTSLDQIDVQLFPNGAIYLMDEGFYLANKSRLMVLPEGFRTIVISNVQIGNSSKYLSMMEEGVDGIISDGFTEDVLTDALQEISRGMAFISPKIAKSLMEYFQSNKSKSFDLSEKELLVVKLLVKGERYASIAEVLNMSINTVRFHVKNIYRKHNIHNKTVLSRYFHDLVYSHHETLKPVYTEV